MRSRCARGRGWGTRGRPRPPPLPRPRRLANPSVPGTLPGIRLRSGSNSPPPSAPFLSGWRFCTSAPARGGSARSLPLSARVRPRARVPQVDGRGAAGPGPGIRFALCGLGRRGSGERSPGTAGWGQSPERPSRRSGRSGHGAGTLHALPGCSTRCRSGTAVSRTPLAQLSRPSQVPGLRAWGAGGASP